MRKRIVPSNKIVHRSSLKQWTALGLVLALVFIHGLAASAMPDAGHGNQVIANVEATLKDEEPLPSYGSFTGVVEEVRPLPSLEGAYHVVIGTDEINTEDGELSPIWFTVTDETLFFDDEGPEAGDTITGFYDKHAPMRMIYPPQYPAVAMAVNPGDTNYFLGYFDEDLVDADNRLMLVIVEETKVLQADGTTYEGSLKNQVLAVAYGPSTRSIPAQTRPEKVMVVPPRENDASAEADAEENDTHDNGIKASPLFGRPITWEDWMPPINTADIVVEMEILEGAPAPMITEERVIMVPLKHIAEALGYPVMWNGELRLAMLSDSFTVTIGQDTYVDMSKDAPISLGTAPVIHEGRTFVPLHFFRDVIPMNNVYYFENQVVIDNQKKMH